MQHRQRQRRPQLAEMNVVPYIDVMLVLLIIFMITAPLLTQGVKVKLPQAAAKTLPARETTPIIVTVNQQGQYFLNIAARPASALSGSRLSAQIASALKHNPKRKVYVRGDRAVNYGKVVTAMVLLQKAGAGTVGLVTQDPQAGG